MDAAAASPAAAAASAIPSGPISPSTAPSAPAPAALAPSAPAPVTPGDDFGALARELENEGYRRWLADRAAAPPGWDDAAFSTVLHLTPTQLAELSAHIRAVIAAYAGQHPPGTPGVLPVAVVSRMFPLLPADTTP